MESRLPRTVASTDASLAARLRSPPAINPERHRYGLRRALGGCILPSWVLAGLCGLGLRCRFPERVLGLARTGRNIIEGVYSVVRAFTRSGGVESFFFSCFINDAYL